MRHIQNFPQPAQHHWVYRKGGGEKSNQTHIKSIFKDHVFFQKAIIKLLLNFICYTDQGDNEVKSKSQRFRGVMKRKK